jgi:hypothetical protein
MKGEEKETAIPPTLVPAPNRPIASPRFPEGNHAEIRRTLGTKMPAPKTPAAKRVAIIMSPVGATLDKKTTIAEDRTLRRMALLDLILSVKYPQGICAIV